MTTRFEIRAFISDYGDRVRLYVVDRDVRPFKAYPGPAQEAVEFAEGDTPETFGMLTLEAAQQLANDLWAAGLRPAQGKQSEGQISATQTHLADMRAIAFAILKVDKP